MQDFLGCESGEKRRQSVSIWKCFGVFMAFATLLLAAPSRAETPVRITFGYGVTYIPLQIMKNQQLVEKHAAELGVNDVKVAWVQLGNASTMIDALLSGNVEFATLGTTPHILAWERTRGGILGLAAFATLPQYLVTINPNVKTIADFTEADKIAMPAAKSSLQATQLQMAAAALFGVQEYEKLDRFTISMSNPDGLAAMKSGQITAHFSNPPFQQLEMELPGAKRLLSSNDIMGGPSTNGILSSTTKYYEQNPSIVRATLAALDEAMEIINKEKDRALDIFFEENPRTDVSREMVLDLISADDVEFSTVPHNTMKYADFMFETGRIKTKPETWKDIFFADIHERDGS